MGASFFRMTFFDAVARGVTSCAIYGGSPIAAIDGLTP